MKPLDYNREGINRAEMTRSAQAAQKAYHKEETKDIKRIMKKMTPEKMADDYISEHSKMADKLTSMPKQSIMHNSDALMEAARAMTRTKIESRMTPDAEKHLQQIKKDIIKIEKAPVYGSDEDKWFTSWKRMDLRVKNDAALNDKDQKWYEYAQQQPWFKSRSDMEELKRQHEGVSQK